MSFVADSSVSVFSVKVYDLVLSFIPGCDLLALNILNLLQVSLDPRNIAFLPILMMGNRTGSWVEMLLVAVGSSFKNLYLFIIYLIPLYSLKRYPVWKIKIGTLRNNMRGKQNKWS